MSNLDRRIMIKVIGPLQVQGADGECLTPIGAKNQALLALLALSPNMSRSRRWIEDKLWSTFGPEQASANLRQALSKLRTALGGDADLLETDRSSVALVSDRVTVDVLEPDMRIEGARELLEGLDVRDPEFEDWLREERGAFQAKLDAARPGSATGLTILCRSEIHGDSMEGLVGEILANQLAEGISEQVRAWRIDHGLPEAGETPAADLSVSCDFLENGCQKAVFVKIAHVPTGHILYTKAQPYEGPGDILNADTGLASIVSEAVDRTLSKLPLTVEKTRPEARATAMSRLAMFRMFSFEMDGLREADNLLSQAFEVDPNGIYLAWRAVLRNIQMIELFDEDRDRLIEESAELSYRALELGGENALLQALVSQVRVMTHGDAAGGMELAKQSVERNPFSGFGWLSLSAASMLAGNTTAALEHSRQAKAIARFSPFRHWWELFDCIVCIAANRPELAIESGEAAARAAPYLRPAQRHLLALYAMDGQMDKAAAAAARLAKIEPGFTLDRFVHDDSYPVRTLRTKGMLEPVKTLL